MAKTVRGIEQWAHESIFFATVSSIFAAVMDAFWRLILAGFLSFAASSLSSAGGLGGGGLYIPILNLVARMDMKDAVSVSSHMVTGSTIANVLYNLPLRHPEIGNKPLIDYDIALLFQPSMLLGVSLGVVCNIMFPEWLITVLFACFLGSSTFTTCKAGFRRWNQESEEADRLGSKNGGRVSRIVEPFLQRNDDGRWCVISCRKLWILGITWVCFFGLQILLAEDHKGRSLFGIKPCGVGYWLIFSCHLPLAIFFTVYVSVVEKSSVDYQQDQVVDDRQEKRRFVLPLIAVASGFLSGLFGIAGGMIISPILLQIGIIPQVAAATTAFMVSFSASMSATQHLLLSMKNLNYALGFSIGCFVSSWLGLAIIQKPIKRYGRPSIIVLLIGTIMTISTLMITCFGALNVWREYVKGDYMGFNLPC